MLISGCRIKRTLRDVVAGYDSLFKCVTIWCLVT